ncbi:MAG: CPBP family intramembrane metalloprotease [Gammaproteobacteria bacterium]|nr:CPBP family intramembrane metalloprotease [Gammaproteobacteria bacterium]
MIPEDRIGRLIVITYFSLTAGVVEELYFRGLLFRALAGCKNHFLIFIAISPVLFSLVHWESGLANVLSTYLFGLFFAGTYLVFQNIWPLVVGHTVTDLVWFSQ